MKIFKIIFGNLIALAFGAGITAGQDAAEATVQPESKTHSSERLKSDHLSLKQILSSHRNGPYNPENREFIEEIAFALYERHDRFASWPENVQLFYACYNINYEVGNGGFAQASYNAPELLPLAQKAFEKFGRNKAADLCQRAVNLLPTELQAYLKKGLNDRPSIEELFKHFDESKMAELDKDLPEEFWADNALQDLVEQNRADFELVDRI